MQKFCKRKLSLIFSITLLAQLLSVTTAALVVLTGARLFALINHLKLAQWPYAVAAALGFIGIAHAKVGKRNLITPLAALAAMVLIIMAVTQVRRDYVRLNFNYYSRRTP